VWVALIVLVIDTVIAILRNRRASDVPELT
jgi:hypothetical protein